MRSFLQAERFYLRKDATYKSVSFLLVAISAAMVFWMWSAAGEISAAYLLEPLGSIMPLSIFLYFILPLYVCFFATEGFESGTVKTVIASGTSRSAYFWGKLLTVVKVNIVLTVQFYAGFMFVFYLLALLTGGDIGTAEMGDKAWLILRAMAYHVLYLTAFAAFSLMVGFLVRKTSFSTILTFVFVFGNFIIYGYWKDSAVPLLKAISDYSLVTRVFSFSTIFVKNSPGHLSGISYHLLTTLTPIAVLAVCISVTLFVFNRRDIPAN
ncbi:hypothetical protein [Gorillibacterium timonense]|uniref:hypothetical protein n=1 Tax=Gorillibacterium timonense TaxID=1689269 RepID=UPI00071E379E|nr:hypothetical protein [Gorillibacterium timonense]